MTRDDGSHNLTTAGRRRSAKSKRTNGVGRTGARFPTIHEEEPDEPDETPTPAPPTPAEAAHASPGAPAPAPSPPATSTSSSSTHPSPADVSPARGSSTHAHSAHASPAHAASAPSAHVSSAHTASASVRSSVAGDVRDGDGDSHTEDEDAEFVGRTGARFGPYSVRKPKRGKEFDTGSTPVVEDQARETPPGEPTPEQSAERTQPLIKPWSGALVRPYAHTGGRTRSSHVLALEALISSNWRPGVGDAVLTTHHRRMIVDLCVQPRSVAEVAALLSVPLGVARVLLGDLATAGVVVVHPTAGASGDGEPDLAFMQRVLVGLRRL